MLLSLVLLCGFGWMKYGISFLDRISQVAPDFGNGAVEFVYSICYSALPFFLGGDTDLGKVYLEKSIDRGKGYLLPRWGRGKYFHQVTGDRPSARQDLEWVASQKPKRVTTHIPGGFISLPMPGLNLTL